MGMFWIAIAAFVLFAQPAVAQPDWTVTGEGEITWVADGDTFRLRAENHDNFEFLKNKAKLKQQRVERDLSVSERFRDDGSFLVRVGNIDTSESVHPDESKNSQAGNRASDYAKSFLDGEQVEYVCWEIGYFGRAICSVRTDGWEYGIHMINQGYSDYVTEYGKHPFWHDSYSEAQRN